MQTTQLRISKHCDYIKALAHRFNNGSRWLMAKKKNKFECTSFKKFKLYLIAVNCFRTKDSA